MKIESGAEWTLGSGNKQHYYVALRDEDGRAALGDAKWDSLSPRRRNLWLTAEAEILVVRHMRQCEQLSKEYARDRIMEWQTVQKGALGE